MHLRHLAPLLACTVSLSLALPASAASATGAWSEAVSGIQGRLIAQDDPPFNGTRMIAVYLELRNVSDVGNPLEIPYDGSNFQGELRDKAGKIVAQAGLSCSIINPPGYFLILPHDSTLRFRVSVTGYGVPKDGGALIGLNNAAWLIQRGDSAAYFLSGPFGPCAMHHFDAKTRNSPSNRKWAGVLQLPPVRIPAPDKARPKAK